MKPACNNNLQAPCNMDLNIHNLHIAWNRPAGPCMSASIPKSVRLQRES